MKKKKIPDIIKQIKQQVQKPVDYLNGEKTISFSQIQIYSECPLKWALQYRDGNKISSPSIHLIFGTALHETIQEYLKVYYEQSGTKADDIDLHGFFQERLSECYKKDFKENNNTHFSSPEELNEFYEDGVSILDFLKKKRGHYFSKRGWHLVGIELPLILRPHNKFKSVVYKGYLDLVLYNEITKKFHILDIKTSKSGWGDREKKNELKTSQLLLYKEFFAKQFNVSKDDINVEFFIVKRKLWEESDFPQKRVQSFIPPSGKNKTSKTLNLLDIFLEECFTLEGVHSDKEHKPKPNTMCKFCPYDKTKLCTK